MAENSDILDHMIMRAPLQMFRGPCVYVVRDGLDVLYVGSSGLGVSRAFSPDHHALKSLTSSSIVIEIFACPNEKTCRAQEELLIAALNPRLNKQRASIKSITKKVLNGLDFKTLAEEIEREVKAVIQRQSTPNGVPEGEQAS